ncbi:MAG: GyrI-like domain-containing protein [Actinomycetota bacterium]|nr:GyrI-like domain-containing protein [Actinomycetota bacterium]
MEPMIEDRAEQPYVGVRRVITMTTFSAVADRIPEIVGWLAERGAAPSGAPFFKYNRIDVDGELEVEVGFPVSSELAGDDIVFASVLPAGRYATVTHVGHPDGLMGVTSGLLEWGVDNGVAWDVRADGVWGARMEVYRTAPRAEPDLGKWETDLVIRLAD